MNAQHGTDSGCRRHFALREDLCDECLTFYRDRLRSKKKREKDEKEALREHGTLRGCRQHWSRGEVLCDECFEVHLDRWDERTRREEEERRERARTKAEGRLPSLIRSALMKIEAAEGEWENWRSIRPAYRDRAEYDGAVWAALETNPDIETYEELHGDIVRRRARLITP